MKMLGNIVVLGLFALLPASAQTSYESIVLADKPSAYWRMGDAPGSAVATDAARNHPASVHGSVSFGQGGVLSDNTAVGMNGAGFFSTTLLQLRAVQYSLEAWVNTFATAAPILQDRGYAEVSNHHPLSITMSVGWLNSFDGKLHCGVDGQEVYLAGATQSVVNDGEWHHVVCVFKGAAGQAVTPQQFSIYVDGQPQTLDYTTIGAAVAPVSGNSGTTIGIHPIWQETSDGFSAYVGILDEVAVYRYALTAGQVLSHYEAATCPHGCQ